MGTAIIKHPVPDRVKPSFVIFDIRALWRSEVKSVLPMPIPSPVINVRYYYAIQITASINRAMVRRMQASRQVLFANY